VTAQITYWNYPGLLASDADRERTAALLRHHSLAGRLTYEEFEVRLAETYAARTIGQLWHALRDLPVERAVVPAPHRQSRSTVPSAAICTLLVILAGTAAIAWWEVTLTVTVALLFTLIVLTMVLGPVIALGAVIYLVVQHGRNRHATRSWVGPPPA